MMNFSFALLLAVALSGVVDVGANRITSSSELRDVLDEFLALVPREVIREIVREYRTNDPEVQRVLEYMKTEEFKELVQKVEAIDDVINFYDYVYAAGLDIYRLINKFHDIIGLPPLVPGRTARNVRMTGGVAGLIKDIKAALPLEDIKALYREKLETSEAFALLVERLHSPRVQELVDALRVNEEFQKIVTFCEAAGVDIDALKKLLETVLGLEFVDRG